MNELKIITEMTPPHRHRSVSCFNLVYAFEIRMGSFQFVLLKILLERVVPLRFPERFCCLLFRSTEQNRKKPIPFTLIERP